MQMMGTARLQCPVHLNDTQITQQTATSGGGEGEERGGERRGRGGAVIMQIYRLYEAPEDS